MRAITGTQLQHISNEAMKQLLELNEQIRSLWVKDQRKAVEAQNGCGSTKCQTQGRHHRLRIKGTRSISLVEEELKLLAMT